MLIIKFDDATGNAFWRGREQQRAQVVDWLLDPATVDGLESAFFRSDDPAAAEALSWAADRLDWVRKQRAAAAATGRMQTVGIGDRAPQSRRKEVLRVAATRRTEGTRLTP